MKYWMFALILMSVLWLQHCRTMQAGPSEVQFDPTAVPYPNLSDYGFFADLQAQQPQTSVLPYEPITPLFTDYAHKARFVWMPDSVQASVNSDGVIEFPDNTVLIKTFYYPADFANPTSSENDLVETRLLMKTAGKWQAFTYVWNEAQSDAALNLVGDFKQVQWKDKEGKAHQIEYAIPNKNQCKSCHNHQNILKPIGPKVKNLNSDFAYAKSETSNQLAKWQSHGFLAASDLPNLSAEWYEGKLTDWEDLDASLEDRALAYLEMNCGHCHNPNGQAHTTGLYLTSDETEPGKLGFCKTPVAAGKGSGGLKYGIVPGQPDSSFLLFRMESDDPGVMMPELGRVIAHEEGIALVREWIASLDGDCEMLQ